MHALSDDQAQKISGGRFLRQLGTRPGPRSLTFGRFLRGGSLAIQSIFTNVNQVNLAVNVALNGGTVINNQANVLSISSSI